MTAPLPDVSTLEGVLGDICRDRASDYSDTALEIAAEPRVNARMFENALLENGAHGSVKLIAEVKRSRPSEIINLELDAVHAAQQYVAGGASAISVLTEPRRFNGSLEDARQVIAAVNVPVLRKDFTVHPRMIAEAQEIGASAVLLLVNVLGALTKAYVDLTHQCGLEALVEVHTEEELDIALASGARIIGVNNRDLKTLEMNLGTAPRVGLLAREYDFDGVLIALSGYSNRAELISLEGVFDAVLIGSSLSGASDIASATRGLLGR
jgi:indole-3-glycerol phosphate synthase